MVKPLSVLPPWSRQDWRGASKTERGAQPRRAAELRQSRCGAERAVSRSASRGRMGVGGRWRGRWRGRVGSSSSGKNPARGFRLPAAELSTEDETRLREERSG